MSDQPFYKPRDYAASAVTQRTLVGDPKARPPTRWRAPRSWHLGCGKYRSRNGSSCTAGAEQPERRHSRRPASRKHGTFARACSSRSRRSARLCPFPLHPPIATLLHRGRRLLRLACRFISEPQAGIRHAGGSRLSDEWPCAPRNWALDARPAPRRRIGRIPIIYGRGLGDLIGPCARACQTADAFLRLFRETMRGPS
jgi:hypothetical protein